MPEIVPLETWGGTANGWPRMTLPAQRIWVHHSVTVPTADALADFRTVNGIGASNGHGGISYSWIIHPDGTIGEGQGTRRGAHTGGNGCGSSPWGWNPCTFGICFVGNYENDEPSAASIEAFRWLRDHLVAESLLVPEPPIDGHRAAPGNQTACPGRNLVSALDALRAPLSPSPATTSEVSVILVGQSQANPGVTYALHPVNGIIAAEFTCRVGEEVYGFPPNAGPYITGQGTGNGQPLPLRFVLPHVIDWLRTVQGYTLTPPAPSASAPGTGPTLAEVRKVVRDELDKTRLAH